MTKENNPKIVRPGDVEFSQSDLEADVLNGQNSQSNNAGNSIETFSSGNYPSTGLEKVSREAIDLFIEGVGEFHRTYFRLDLRKELLPLLAYFYNTKTHNNDEFIYFKRYTDKLNFAEAVRNVFDPRILKTNILPDINNLSEEINQEELIKVFPEYRLIKESIKPVKGSLPVDLFYELLKLPPLGKTFFSGLLHSLGSLNYVNSDKKTDFSKEVKIPVLTAEIFDYAESIDVRNVPYYLMLLNRDKK